MTQTAPGGPRPGPVATGLVRLAVRALPPEFRNRYEDEFVADLCCLPHRRQLPHSVGLLLGAVPLRRAVREARAQSDVYWLCRWGRHQYVVVSDGNPEEPAAAHRECVRCLKTHPLKMDMNQAQTIWGTGWSPNGIG